MVMVGQGELKRAANLCRTRIETSQAANGGDIPALCHLYNTLGYVLYEWNHREEAVEALTRGLLLSLRVGYGPYGNAVRISTALLKRLQQLAVEEGASISLSSEVETAVTEHPSDLKAVGLLGWRVRLWLTQGDMDIASRWAEAYTAGTAPPGPWPVYGDLALAHVWLAQGKVRAALEQVRRTQEKTQAAGAIGWQITTGSLKATLYQRLGEERAALDALDRALTLAEPGGWIRVFADEGAALRPLLHRLIAQGKTGRFGREILAAIRRSPEESVQVVESPQLLDPLTPRELEVLRLLPTELSHAEIGETLFIARSTVRSHVKQIYAKLDVSDRTQAVLRAQELGLL
jgi:LuxR family maltose regulon positive regulatory protein